MPTARKNSQKQHPAHRSKKIPTLSIRNIKAHPLISLSSVAVALSAVSGLIAWYRVKKNNVKRFFFIRKR